MARKYIMTARRRAALRKAQLASARKRRKGAKSKYKKTRRAAKTTYRSTKNRANARYNRTMRAAYTRNRLSGYDSMVEAGNRAINSGGPISKILGENTNALATHMYGSQLASYNRTLAKASGARTTTIRGARKTYRSTKKRAKTSYKRSKRGR